MNRPITLITGGSRGLGRNAAIHLAKAGHDLILTYHSQKEAAEQVASEVGLLGAKVQVAPLDTGNTASFPVFAQTLECLLQTHWGVRHFQALVNNAGVGIHVPFCETTEAQFDQLVNIHLKGVFFLTQRLLPLLADGGRILNVSTGLARFALPGYAAYAAMKGAVEVLTRYLAKELGPRGISVNTLAPGAIETDFGGGSVRDIPSLNQAIAAQTALGRVGVPDDIGAVVAALLGPGMGWINAQRIEASGGMFL